VVTTGTAASRLIVLRGNSGSGKSSTARELRAKLGRGTAWVEQDQLRRILLWERDLPGAVNIGLIDQTARYALDHGYDVIVEGILDAGRYGEMLGALTADHLGVTRHYYFDIPFDETVVRHANRDWAHDVTAEMMREWYRERDLLADVDQQVIEQSSSLEQTVERILSDLGWDRVTSEQFSARPVSDLK
jgi:predicted kinase